MKAIINGRLVLEDRVLDGQAVLFENTISRIVPQEELPRDAETIDAKGAWVCPGFFDLHIHGSGGCDTMDGTPEALMTISRTIARKGVTRFLPTSVTMPMADTERVFTQIRALLGTGEGAIIEGINMEGPFLSAAYRGAHDPESLRPADAAFVRRFADVIRLVTVAPEEPGGMEFVEEIARNTPVKVSIGHSAATYEQAMEAIARGATQVTHLFNAMSPLHHRKPGVVTAALQSDVYTELICDGIHVHPALFSFVCQNKTDRESGLCDRLVLITDCMRAGAMPPGQYTLGELRVVVDDTSARLADGTLAGSILSLDRAVENFARHTGCPLWQAVRCASLNPARALGMEERLGSIAPGKEADFALLDSELRVVRTIVSGRTVYEAE